MGGGLPGGDAARFGRAEKPAADAVAACGGAVDDARLFAPHCLQQVNLLEVSPPHLGLSWYFLPQSQVRRIGVFFFLTLLARWRSLSCRSLARGADSAASDGCWIASASVPGVRCCPRMRSAMSSPLSVRECVAPHRQPLHTSVYVRPAMMSRILFRASAGAATSAWSAVGAACSSGVRGHSMCPSFLTAGLGGGTHRLVRT